MKLKVIPMPRHHAPLAIGPPLLWFALAGCSGEAVNNQPESITDAEIKQIAKTSKNARNFHKAIQNQIRENTVSEPAPRTKAKSVR